MKCSKRSRQFANRGECEPMKFEMASCKIAADRNERICQPVTVTDATATSSLPSATPMRQLHSPLSESTAAEIVAPHSPYESPSPS